jgi:hypothetical protein
MRIENAFLFMARMLLQFGRYFCDLSNMSDVFRAPRVHRAAGLLLVAPLLLWIATGLLFHVKPGWDAAYETLAAPPPGPLPWERVVFSPAMLEARGLLDPGPVALAPHPSGLVAVYGRRAGLPAAVDGTSGEPIPAAPEESARAFALAAIGASRHAGRYGAILPGAEAAVHRSALTGADDPAFLFRTAGGHRLLVDRVTGEVSQESALRDRIELLYRVHYLQWTPWGPFNAALVVAASLLVLLLAGSGIRLLLARPARPPGAPEP